MSGRPAADRPTALATSILGAYFEISYRLLSSRAGARLLEQAASVPGIDAHGYVTADDLVALEAALRPSPSRRLVDLGCGFGDIARWLHARSKAEIVGFDVSRRAIWEARRRARRDGVESAVHFEVGTLEVPAAIGAVDAYAIDSLMFTPDLPNTIRGIAASLGGGGRLFATLLVFGPDPARTLSRVEAETRSTRLLLTDVTPDLAEASRRRRHVARSLSRTGGLSLSEKAAMLLVMAEECALGAMLRRGKIHRVRWAIELSRAKPADRDQTARAILAV